MQGTGNSCLQLNKSVVSFGMVGTDAYVNGRTTKNLSLCYIRSYRHIVPSLLSFLNFFKSTKLFEMVPN